MGTVTPGARNFNGVSRNEMASTMPNQTSVAAAQSAAVQESMAGVYTGEDV
jgi:hypothetical protein